jgi:hypothetical protein
MDNWKRRMVIVSFEATMCSTFLLKRSDSLVMDWRMINKNVLYREWIRCNWISQEIVALKDVKFTTQSS